MKTATETTRKPELLEAQLLAVWQKASATWNSDSKKPRVFITQTTRSCIDQMKAFNSGKSKARCGQSLHNYEPALAFDVAFTPNGRDLDWSKKLFAEFADICKSEGLEWGGDWKGFYDGPHFQLPMTWQDAKIGHVPRLKKQGGCDRAGAMKLLQQALEKLKKC